MRKINFIINGLEISIFPLYNLLPGIIIDCLLNVQLVSKKTLVTSN